MELIALILFFICINNVFDYLVYLVMRKSMDILIKNECKRYKELNEIQKELNSISDDIDKDIDKVKIILYDIRLDRCRKRLNKN